MKMYQQGDVLMFQIEKSEIPIDAKKVERKNGRFVLAEGEATGHAHTILEDIELLTFGNDLFLTTTQETPVRHEEHKTITIPPGHWRVSRVVEVDPFTKEIHTIKD